jgi:protein-tyrosine phosphatase
VDPDEARRKLELLVGAGVDSIVDLSTKGELRPYESVLGTVAGEAGREVRHLSYPIPDMGVVDDAGYDEILAVIGEELDARRTVYVHCWGGMGRTTTVIGCLLAETGLDYQSVIARIAALRAGTRKASTAYPQTEAQRAVIRRRCDRVRARGR